MMMNAKNRTHSNRKEEEEEEYNKFIEENNTADQNNYAFDKKKKNKKQTLTPLDEQKLVQPISKRLKTSRSSSFKSFGAQETDSLQTLNKEQNENPEIETKKPTKKKKKKNLPPPSKKVNKTSNCNVIVQDVPQLPELIARKPNLEEQEFLLEIQDDLIDPMEEELQPKSSNLSSPAFGYSPTYSTSPNFAKILPAPVHSYPNFLSVLSNSRLRPPGMRVSMPILSSLQGSSFIEDEENGKEEKSRSPSPEREESINMETNSDGRVFSCPFCEKGDLNEVQLTTHIFKTHPKDKHNKQTVCPVCSSKSNGDPNYASRDFFGHLKLRHSGHQPETTVKKLSRASGIAFKPAEIITRTPRNIFLGNMGLGRGLDRGKDASELLWDYVLALDTNQGLDVDNIDVNCDVCHAPVESFAETRAILPCSHTFHADCLPNEADPKCPTCNMVKRPAKKKTKAKKKKATKTNASMEL